MFNFFKAKTPNSNPVFDKFLQQSKNQILFFEQRKKLTKQGQFEVLIFCAYLILNNSNLENDLKMKYLRYLVDIRKDYNVSISSGQTVDLINQRISFIEQEFKKIYGSQNYINGGLYHIFYENPLTLSPENSYNLPEVMIFSIAFANVVKNFTSS